MLVNDRKPEIYSCRRVWYLGKDTFWIGPRSIVQKTYQRTVFLLEDRICGHVV